MKAKGMGCAVMGLMAAIGVVLIRLLFAPGEEKVAMTAAAHPTHGTAVYMLLDTSGSMGDSTNNAQGGGEAKLAVAKRAAIAACRQIAKYGEEDKTRNIQLAIASFSDTVVPLVPMGKPNVAAAERAINGMHASGDTAIGRAVMQAQQSLDRTGLTGQHILLVTDGENTTGVSPDRVAKAISILPEELRPMTYVVAFDVNARVFDSVKSQGWQVFSAANGKELEQRLDEVVGGHILLEKF